MVNYEVCQGFNAFFRQQKFAQSGQRPRGIYFSALLKNITVPFVVITGSPGLRKHVWDVERRLVQLKRGSAGLAIPWQFAT